MKKHKLTYSKPSKYRTYLRSKCKHLTENLEWSVGVHVESKTQGFSKNQSWDLISSVPEELFREEV